MGTHDAIAWALFNIVSSLTRVGHGKEAASAGVDHGDDTGDEDARGQLSAEQEADDDRQTNLGWFERSTAFEI